MTIHRHFEVNCTFFLRKAPFSDGKIQNIRSVSLVGQDAAVI